MTRVKNLKNNGYNLEHNFGHGKNNLSAVFVSLNLLAFAFHTVCDLAEDLWRGALEKMGTRARFFENPRSLTTFVIFPTWDDLLVRRFHCRNPACPRRTFAEPLPNLLAPRARRTRRLATAQSGVGVSCGGEAGARLLHRLGMPASADTVPHLVRAIPLPVSKGSRSWHTTRTHPWDVGCRRGVARVSEHANRPVALSMAT
jgi:hypothetical protein